MFDVQRSGSLRAGGAEAAGERPVVDSSSSAGSDRRGRGTAWEYA